MTFAHEEGSFLVGAAAALESETGRIGYIGANSSPLIEGFRAGFEQGARAADPGIEVVSAIIDPDDFGGRVPAPADAQAIAERMYTEANVDIIFTAAGLSGRGTIDAATELSEDVGRHLWAIGVDTDYLFELPELQRGHLLTSMLKRFDLGVEEAVARYEAGTLEVPSTVRLGLAEGAIGYSTSGDRMQATTVADRSRPPGAHRQRRDRRRPDTDRPTERTLDGHDLVPRDARGTGGRVRLTRWRGTMQGHGC